MLDDKIFLKVSFIQFKVGNEIFILRTDMNVVVFSQVTLHFSLNVYL